MVQKENPFRGGTFDNGGFNICPTSKNVNTPFKLVTLLNVENMALISQGGGKINKFSFSS